MAKTAEPQGRDRPAHHGAAATSTGLDRELLIFDVLTFTLTDRRRRVAPVAVETIEGIRRVKEELPGVKTSLGVSNVSFGVSARARAS
jgi:5-methyltetrahydrofolate--homocysteine methyltransferase